MLVFFTHSIFQVEAMRTSSYFNDALFYNQNSVIDQYFEKRSAQIFTSDKATSYIDIYYQSRSKKITLEETSLDDKKRSDSQKPDPDLYWQTESAPLTPVDHEPVDHESFLYQCPPRYNGSPGIETRKLSDVNLLSQIAVVSQGFLPDMGLSIRLTSDIQGVKVLLPHMVI